MSAANIIFGGALAFIFGVAIASLGWSVPLLLLSFIGLGIVLLIVFKLVGLWKVLIAFTIAIFFGAFYYHLYFNIEKLSENIPLNKKITFSGVVSNEPLGSEKYLSFDLELLPPLSGMIRVLTSPLAQIHYGDEMRLEGKIITAERIGQEPVIFFPKLKVIAEHKGFWLREKLIAFKMRLTAQFDKVLPTNEAALLGGITLGSRSGFGADFKKQMSLSGTTHLVALSGYNIAILVLAVARAFGSFLSRRKTFYVTLCIIVLFVLMVGAEASVIRAALMGFLLLLANETGRIYNQKNAMALAAVLMTLHNPSVLTLSVGFQLSFLSLMGIVYLAPTIERALKMRDGGFAGWRENAVMTASAQIAVMPVIIQVFGQFSLAAILANILILEFIPLTMLFGFLLAALSSVYFYLGFFIGKLVGVLLFYEVWIIELFSKIRIPVPVHFGGWLTIFYYAALGLAVYYYWPKNPSQK